MEKKYNSNLLILSQDDKKLSTLEIARLGNFIPEKYGGQEISITENMLSDFKRNFENDVHGMRDEQGNPTVPLNFAHEKEQKAAGWVKELNLSEGVLSLGIEMTPIGREKVEKKEFLYGSIEATRMFRNIRTNERIKNVFTGAALTNVPVLRNMAAMQLSQHKKGYNMMTPEELVMEFMEFGDAEKAIVMQKIQEYSAKMKNPMEKPMMDEYPMPAKPKTMEYSQKDSETKNFGTQELSPEVLAMAKEIEDLKQHNLLQKNEMMFSQHVAEGKMVPAQREGFIKGDLELMMKHAMPIGDINFSQQSFAGVPKEKEKITIETVEKKVKELMKENPELQFSQAMKEVAINDKEVSNFIN